MFVYWNCRKRFSIRFTLKRRYLTVSRLSAWYRVHHDFFLGTYMCWWYPRDQIGQRLWCWSVDLSPEYLFASTWAAGTGLCKARTVYQHSLRQRGSCNHKDAKPRQISPHAREPVHNDIFRLTFLEALNQPLASRCSSCYCYSDPGDPSTPHSKRDSSKSNPHSTLPKLCRFHWRNSLWSGRPVCHAHTSNMLRFVMEFQ